MRIPRHHIQYCSPCTQAVSHVSSKQTYYRGFLMLTILLLPFTPLLSHAEKMESRPKGWEILARSLLVGTAIMKRETSSIPSPLPHPIKRASPSHVGSVMAILATLEDSQILPPENSPQATKIIQAVIQFQSAFMKSSHPAVLRFLEEACKDKFGAHSVSEVSRLRTHGWTSQTLEAVVDYDVTHNVWTPTLEEGMRVYNMRREDFKLLAHIYRQARTSFIQRRQDIHQVFRQWRGQMPGVR